MFGKIHFNFAIARRNVLAVLTLAAMVLVYSWRLGGIVPGLSPAEVANISNSHSLHSLLHHPINAPHNILIWLLIKLHLTGIVYFRGISVLFALVFLVCFYKVALSWFGPFIAWLATILLASTPLVWLSGRSATADIMFLMPVAISACYFWLSRAKTHSKLKFLLLLAAAALYLYTPGALYFLILGLIAAYRPVAAIAKAYPVWLRWVGALMFLFILAPLAAGLIKEPSAAKQLLLVPASTKPLVILKEIGWMGLGLFWKSGRHFDLQVDRLAVLNFVQTILAVFGLYAFWTRARAKLYGLAILIFIAVIAAGLSSSLTMLMPAVVGAIILAAAGLRYLLIEWQGVFPRNPLPRAFAVALMSCAVLMGTYYGLRYSLAAWPHSPQTRQLYVLKYKAE